MTPLNSQLKKKLSFGRGKESTTSRMLIQFSVVCVRLEALQRPELTAVDAQVLLQVVFVLEGLGTLVALELAGPGGSSQTCCRLQNVTLRERDKNN